LKLISKQKIEKHEAAIARAAEGLPPRTGKTFPSVSLPR
jgi:hypothetical protein